MKALVVPGITDLNKGDQALVWESVRLIKDANLYDDVYVLSSGDTKEEFNALCGQTIQRGFTLVERILKHPRRGFHPRNDVTKDGLRYTAFQIKNAVLDYVLGNIILLVCRSRALTRLIFPSRIAGTLDRFREVDTVFVKGGGFIHAHGERTAPYKMWYLLFYLRLALRLKKQVIVLPNSFGPFEGISVKRQVQGIIGRATKVYARERSSAVALGSILDRVIPVYPDLGFYLDAASSRTVSALLDKYSLTGGRTVGLTLRPWRFPGSDNSSELYENYINSIIELLEHLLSQGFRVALFNQSMGPNRHEDDREAIRYLFSKAPERLRNQLSWVDEDLTCDELKALYSNLYALVGTRFHSFIFSISARVPSMAIAYGGNKATGIMTDMGLDNYVIDIGQVTGHALIDMFSRLQVNYEEIRSKLPESLAEIHRYRELLIDDVRSSIAPRD